MNTEFQALDPESFFAANFTPLLSRIMRQHEAVEARAERRVLRVSAFALCLGLFFGAFFRDFFGQGRSAEFADGEATTEQAANF